MKHITVYLDVVSPYAYLAFELLPTTLLGHSYRTTYRPVFLAAMLKHHGQKGPAEIADKQRWLSRHVSWLAQQQGVALQLPARHPFDALPLLRLALACGDSGCVNRYVFERIFHHVWHGGQDAGEAQRLHLLQQQLAPKRAIDDQAVKAELKTNTDQAIKAGAFGVPSFEVDGKLFWGLDALPMLKAYLDGNSWFDRSWDALAHPVTPLPR